VFSVGADSKGAIVATPVEMMLGGFQLAPPSPCFSQVFILKVVKALCFDTLSQVLILNVLTGVAFCIAGRRSRYGSAVLRKRAMAGSMEAQSA